MQVDKVSLLPQVTKHHLLKKYLIMAEGINDALTILKRKIHDVQTHSIQKPQKEYFLSESLPNQNFETCIHFSNLKPSFFPFLLLMCR